MRVVFIPKKGKDDYCDVKAWRAISLSPFILKGLERVLDIYLRGSVLLRNPFSPVQFAYFKGRSTDGALHSVVNTIERAFQFNDSALGVSVDIVGAFDNTSYSVIRDSLLSFGIKSFLIDWVIDMLEARRISASLGEYSVSVSATRGCPQGGVLSPLLWLLVIDSLLTELTNASSPPWAMQMMSLSLWSVVLSQLCMKEYRLG